MTAITEQEFERVAAFVLEHAGIQLEKGKEYLVEARLQPLLERYQLQSYKELLQKAVQDTSDDVKTRIVNAITINETYFFRDQSPFELIKNKILPDIIDIRSQQYKQGQIPIKIWSAACSTGQEVYSLAITLLEMLPDIQRFNLNILGTDISSDAVAKASYGKYNQFEIDRGLGSYFLNKYFNQVPNGWRIKDQVRGLVRFSRFDLNQPFSSLGTFDLVMCRNVAIYFPMQGKIRLFQKIANVLNPNGVLMVGGSESLAGIATDFVPRHYLNGVFYQVRRSQQDAPSVSKVKFSKPVRKPAPTPVNPPAITTAPPPPPRPVRSSMTNERLVRQKPPAAEKSEPVVAVPPPVKPVIPDPAPAPPPVDIQQPPEGGSLLNRIQGKAKPGSDSLLGRSSQQGAKKKSLLQVLREKEED